MDSLRNDYLNKIDKYLRPLPASERADIINEIKSQMMELEAEKRLSSDQIIQRLGNPKELAGALLICGVIAPVSGLIQAVGFLLGFDVPWVSFQFGSWTAHPLLALPLHPLWYPFYAGGKGPVEDYSQIYSGRLPPKKFVITGYN